MSFQSTNIWARGWSWSLDILFLMVAFCAIAVFLSTTKWAIKVVQKKSKTPFKKNRLSRIFFISSPIIIIFFVLFELFWRLDAFYGISTFYVSYWWHYLIFTIFTYLIILAIWIIKGFYLDVWKDYKVELVSFKNLCAKLGNGIVHFLTHPQQIFSRRKKSRSKQKEIHDNVYAPVKGEIINLKKVKDEAFATGALGQGFGIQIKGTKVVFTSPIDGEVATIFPTGHAYGIQSKNGTSILVHIGIDTVQLKGKYFKIISKQGDKVKAGQPIVEAQVSSIKKAGYDTTTMVICTTDTKGTPELMNFKTKQIVSQKDIILEVKG